MRNDYNHAPPKHNVRLTLAKNEHYGTFTEHCNEKTNIRLNASQVTGFDIVTFSVPTRYSEPHMTTTQRITSYWSQFQLCTMTQRITSYWFR